MDEKTYILKVSEFESSSIDASIGFLNPSIINFMRSNKGGFERKVKLKINLNRLQKEKEIDVKLEIFMKSKPSKQTLTDTMFEEYLKYKSLEKIRSL